MTSCGFMRTVYIWSMNVLKRMFTNYKCIEYNNKRRNITSLNFSFAQNWKISLKSASLDKIARKFAFYVTLYINVLDIKLRFNLMRCKPVPLVYFIQQNLGFREIRIRTLEFDSYDFDF